MTLTSTTRPRLHLLQAFRAIAAIGVLLFHVQLVADRRMGISFLGNMFTEGRFGVDFFFVLSGFIITYVHATDLGHPNRTGEYLRKRIVRIYPLLIVLTLGKLLAMLVLPQMVGEHQLDAPLIVKSLLIWPQKPIPILPMAWTLTHELLFYLLFATGLLFGYRFWRRLRIGWAISIVLVSWWMEGTGHPDDINLAARFVFHPHNLQFLMGCLVAERFRDGPRRKRVLAMMFAVAGVIAALKMALLWDMHGKLPSCLAWGACFTLVVWAAATWELTYGSHVDRLWNLLGDASYSIYLVNTPIIAAVGVIVAKFVPADGIAVQMALIATALVSVGCGVVCYWLLERPLTQLFRRPRTSRLSPTNM